MKPSHTSPRAVSFTIDMDLGEMETVISALQGRIDEGTNDWQERELLASIKRTKASSVAQLVQSLELYQE